MMFSLFVFELFDHDRLRKTMEQGFSHISSSSVFKRLLAISYLLKKLFQYCQLTSIQREVLM